MAVNYWNMPWFRYFYRVLEDNASLEHNVDHMWYTILLHHFPIDQRYNVFVRTRLNAASAKIPDVMVKRLDNNEPVSILLVESKRASFSNNPSKWNYARREIEDYLELEYVNSQLKPQFQVGMVTIGLWVRFYRRTGAVRALVDYSPQASRAFHIWDDRFDVQSILEAIKNETQ
ncbi:hypothetical protein FQN49_003657 [Arthroderma sp. PD_2]|nr:hypothetical protein FQN49_003657 [Arthroderma sp. PD_2]